MHGQSKIDEGKNLAKGLWRETLNKITQGFEDHAQDSGLIKKKKKQTSFKSSVMLSVRSFKTELLL